MTFGLSVGRSGMNTGDGILGANARGSAVAEWRTSPCKFFAKGRCTRGTLCRFKHEVDAAISKSYPVEKENSPNGMNSKRDSPSKGGKNRKFAYKKYKYASSEVGDTAQVSRISLNEQPEIRQPLQWRKSIPSHNLDQTSQHQSQNSKESLRNQQSDLQTQSGPTPAAFDTKASTPGASLLKHTVPSTVDGTVEGTVDPIHLRLSVDAADALKCGETPRSISRLPVFTLLGGLLDRSALNS